METNKNSLSKFLTILLGAISAIAIAFWIIMLFFTFFMGGSPGPDHERMVPYFYVAIVALGFVGAVTGLVTAVKRETPRTKMLLILSVVLGVCGSIPFFLLELEVVLITALLAGVLPPLLHFVLFQKIH